MNVANCNAPISGLARPLKICSLLYMFSDPEVSARSVARCGGEPQYATRNSVSRKIVGYARAYRDPRSLAFQVSKLGGAGASLHYSDEASGAAIIRPGFASAIAALDEGDCLAVVSLERIAWRDDTLRQVIADIEARGAHLWSLAEDFDTRSKVDVFSIIRALEAFSAGVRTARKLEAAPLGRVDNRQKIECASWDNMRRRLDAGEISPAKAAQILGVARSTVLRRRRADRAVGVADCAAPTKGPVAISEGLHDD